MTSTYADVPLDQLGREAMARITDAALAQLLGFIKRYVTL